MMLRRIARLLSICALGAAVPACAAPFKHIVIIVQENRSIDNLFGSNPTFEAGVDVATSGLDTHGRRIPLTPVSLAGCYDISHSNASFLSLYDGGKMDGANKEEVKLNSGCKPPGNPQFKYVSNANGEVQPYFDIASQYGFANRMFQTNQGPSFPAHQFLFGGTSAPDENSPLFAAENLKAHRLAGGCVAPSLQRVKVIDHAGNERANPQIYPCFERPTLPSLLESAGVSWKYYVNTLKEGTIWTAPAAIRSICGPTTVGRELVCTNAQYTAHVDGRQAQVLSDVAGCNLAGVSWVIPDAADSDHAATNQGRGPAWVASIVNAIGTRAACPDGDHYWDDTAILITWDDWGGWYDHVPPYHVGGWGGAHDWGAGYTYGTRVPLLVVSAYTKPGYVDNANHDFGSILKFVETNYGLPTIGPGYYADAYADALSGFFPLTSPRTYRLVSAPLGPADFLNAKRSEVGPDED